MLEQAVGDAQYVVGAELTIVDVYVVMLRSWFDGELQTLRLDQIKISVLAHPLLGPLWRRHFPDD